MKKILLLILTLVLVASMMTSCLPLSILFLLLDQESEIITNEGAGLPEGEEGIFKIDFTKADKVKNVTDQGYYLGGCPTTGKVPVLVIPVEFSDSPAASKGYTIQTIQNAFYGNRTNYYSVEEYYYLSSYGNLDLDFNVLDHWFKPEFSSKHYEKLTDIDEYGEEYYVGDQVIMDEALSYLEDVMDLSAYDSDKNGIIDAVVMVNTLTVNPEKDFHWAYRGWNTYTDEDGNKQEYDGVSANDYLWMAYGFMHESSDSEGNPIYTNKSILNTFTYIHEFGHILGADDYYDTEYLSDSTPLEGYDIMDETLGDHNPYTKFNYGWITTSRLITTDTSVTLTLESFEKSGDTIIIANNWDESLGVYQEYYVIIYYTKTLLNRTANGYFLNNGIVVYHVNASLYSYELDGKTFYDVYNNNTSYLGILGTGTKDNLIELVKSGGAVLFTKGNSLKTQTDDLGNELCYTFTVDLLTNNSATLTFTKKGLSH